MDFIVDNCAREVLFHKGFVSLSSGLNPTIAELTQAIDQEVEKFPAAQRLMAHPGVGTLTALAFVLIIGKAERFHCGKQVASYLGLVPLEESSANRRRLGRITKPGSSMMRFLLVEAAQEGRRLPSEIWRLWQPYRHRTPDCGVARGHPGMRKA